jgi:hypothetical protein
MRLELIYKMKWICCKKKNIQSFCKTQNL